MGNAKILVAGTRAARLAYRAEFVKRHQPMLFEAPRNFPFIDRWYHQTLRTLRARQNGRWRNLHKARRLMMNYEYKQYLARQRQAYSSEDF